MDVLVFELGGQRYGIPLLQVRTLLRAVAFVRLPKAPGIVEGIVDLRGQIVPVLDIRARFRLARKALDYRDHLIVAVIGARVVGLRVDRVISLASVELQPVQNEIRGADYLAGVARQPDGLVLIHDLSTFLSAAEAESLDELSREKYASGEAR